MVACLLNLNHDIICQGQRKCNRSAFDCLNFFYLLKEIAKMSGAENGCLLLLVIGGILMFIDSSLLSSIWYQDFYMLRTKENVKVVCLLNLVSGFVFVKDKGKRNSSLLACSIWYQDFYLSRTKENVKVVPLCLNFLNLLKEIAKIRGGAINGCFLLLVTGDILISIGFSL